jgi:hypothetical protein
MEVIQHNMDAWLSKIQSKDNSSTDNPESIHIVINPLKDVEEFYEPTYS